MTTRKEDKRSVKSRNAIKNAFKEIVLTQDMSRIVIKELAEKESCIILGRCGDYVLRDRDNVLRTFVFAPLEQRIAFAKSRPGAKDMADRLWETTLAKHDRARASYYNYYTENRWGEAKNYDLCLNAALGRETCAQMIVDAARAMQARL